MLYQADRHEPLQPLPWNESHVLDVIQTIANDTIQRFDPELFWPIHPLDQEFPPTTIAYKGLYMGATGILWTLYYLLQVEAIAIPFDPTTSIQAVYHAYLQTPDTGAILPSYLLGELGISLVLWRLLPSETVSDRLYATIEATRPSPDDTVWNLPGAMLATLFMLEWTQERPWEELFLQKVAQLWDAQLWDTQLWNAQLWNEWRDAAVGRDEDRPQLVNHSSVNLSGPLQIGAVNGLAGNFYALLRGVHLLPQAKQDQLYQRCVEAIEPTARVEGGYANWLAVTDDASPLLQWCHGAPGIITSLGDFPVQYSPSLDQLLLQAGDLIWQAGPLAQDPGLCQGTAGNGYAFLKLFQRTEDEQWLERARAFAGHAIGQYQQMQQQYQQGRYSLWTGDLGLAVYLWHCINGEANFPSLDIF